MHNSFKFRKFIIYTREDIVFFVNYRHAILTTNVHAKNGILIYSRCKFLILIMKKKLKTIKNLLPLSKSLLVPIARTWDSLRSSVSQNVFNTSKFWLILSENFFDVGMEFVYEKMTAYKLVSLRKSIFSIRIFSTLYNSYITNITCTFL